MPSELFTENAYITWSVLAIDWIIRLSLGARVVLRRGPVGFSLAWLAVILLLPVLGAVIYLIMGERRLGGKRARRVAELREPYRLWLTGLAESFPIHSLELGKTATMLRRQARSTVGIPALPGNTIELIPQANLFFDRLIADIDAAASSVHLEFYIWEPGGRADEVTAALIRAAGRGVTCRVLVDDVGGDALLKSDQFDQLAKAGVRVVPLLEVGVVRTMLARIDLRNHRKIVVIDGVVAYTGSQNIADPKQFMADAELGEWIDAMVRVTGPAVEALQVTILADWDFETSEGIDKHVADFDLKRNQPTGNTLIQVVPSGPGLTQLAIQELILTGIYAAQKELVLTSPYFIPDDAMIKALLSAAARGVDVTLSVPRYPDSRIVKWAGEAYFEELLEGGVKVFRFEGGLLHTKAITIDNEIAMFGSVNLDMRSFNLNFEISLIVYDETFTHRVRRLQAKYLQGSQQLDLFLWRARPVWLRFAQNACQLLSPLL